MVTLTSVRAMGSVVPALSVQVLPAQLAVQLHRHGPTAIDETSPARPGGSKVRQAAPRRDPGDTIECASERGRLGTGRDGEGTYGGLLPVEHRFVYPHNTARREMTRCAPIAVGSSVGMPAHRKVKVSRARAQQHLVSLRPLQCCVPVADSCTTAEPALQ